MLFYFACEAAGALSARHSLRPLFSEGERIVHRSGVSRRGIAEVCLRTRVVIASEAKQSIFDLAMPSHGLLRFARNDSFNWEFWPFEIEPVFHLGPLAGRDRRAAPERGDYPRASPCRRPLAQPSPRKREFFPTPAERRPHRSPPRRCPSPCVPERRRSPKCSRRKIAPA